MLHVCRRSQAGKDSVGTASMKRALLLKAGQVLSPDAFMLVLESESSNKGLSLFCFFLLVISHPAVSFCIALNKFISVFQS